MKNLIARMLTPLFPVVLLLAGSASAQYVPRVVEVKLPFEFTIGEKAFPAGRYSFVRRGPGRLDLRDSRRHVLASLITFGVQSPETSAVPRLQFSTANGGHALTEVWFQGERIGDQLVPSKRANAVAKENVRKPVETGNAGSQ